MLIRIGEFVLLLALSFVATSVAQVRHELDDTTFTILAEGYAGVYPDILKGRVTASGARYDPDALVAAHRTLPLGVLVRVLREDTGESVAVRVVDRGPYTRDRVMDLSEAAARALGMRRGQVAYIRILRAQPDAESPDDGGDTGHDLTRGGFTIQLGSYSSLQSAEDARGRAEGAWIQTVEVNSQTFYRLNFGRYESRDEGAEDLQWLEAHGFFGFVKSLPKAAEGTR